MNRFRLALLVAAIAVGNIWASPASARVVCNEFNLVTQVVGRQVAFRLETDLPPGTSVMASVRRQWWTIGGKETMSSAYYGEKTTVGELRELVEVTLDDTEWKKKLAEGQRVLSVFGEPSQIRSISDSVIVDLVVPVGQASPAFGRGNKDLHGPFVEERPLRTISAEKALRIPIREPAGDASRKTKKRSSAPEFKLRPGYVICESDLQLMWFVAMTHEDLFKPQPKGTKMPLEVRGKKAQKALRESWCGTTDDLEFFSAEIMEDCTAQLSYPNGGCRKIRVRPKNSDHWTTWHTFGDALSK